MKQVYHAIFRNYLTIMAIAVTIFSMAIPAHALDVSTYAASSRLASGNWVKVRVSGTGMHLISETQLRSWGLEPSRTKVYGYGGKRLPDRLDTDYVDDMPQTPSEYVGGRGVFFYAVGTRTWTKNAIGGFTTAHNPFTDYGFYYLSDSGDDERFIPTESGSPVNPNGLDASVFLCNLVHENDLSSPGNVGFLLVGEDFRYNPSQTFNFQLENPADNQECKMEVSFAGHTQGGKGTLSFTVNGTQLPTVSSDSFDPITGGYNKGRLHNIRKSFAFSGSKLNIGVKLAYAGTLMRANLDYIAISYPRHLVMPSDRNLSFSIDRGQVVLGGAGSDTRVWDVTTPLEATRLNVSVADGKVAWNSSFGAGVRDYAAWEPGGNYPAPAFVENVTSQNIHAKSTPDMVIFTPAQWRNQAERLAQLHRDDPVEPLEVLVLTDKQVYNEFSSGSPDAQAFRKVLKMFYDRGIGNAVGGADSKLRYALFFGRLTFDPRLLTPNVKALGYPMLPGWFTDSGMSENDSYTTDDMFAFLQDGSGVNLGRDRLCIAVGRLPVVSEKEAKAAVDKINYYNTRMPADDWKNNVLVFADDQDHADHMEDADIMSDFMSKSASGDDLFIRKIYSDEFELINNEYPEAKSRLLRILDEGVALWAFQGHGSPTGLTHEKVVTFTDLNSLDLRHWPVLYAATCDFVKWDDPARSGAEVLFNNPNGGVIAAISAIRPVYISMNGQLSAAFGRCFFDRDDDGNIVTIGEGYRRAKNDYRNERGELVADENKLRYVLLGDPAVRIVTPSNRVVLDEIAGVPVSAFDSDDEPPTLMARQETKVKGRVVSASDGQTMTDFNGMLYVTLYDAEESVTTRGNGKDGSPFTFDRQGGRLFAGNAVVSDGEFTLNLIMPAEVANNYRPAAFNLYACSNSRENPVEAASVCRKLYVYGEDPEAVPDNEPPVIESIYLNHPTFVNGAQVNPNPMLIARVTDNRAINLSNSGVGHVMTLSLDNGDQTYGDVAEYFTPLTDGTPGGNIYYPLSNLKDGYHTLTLRVWDVGPNSAEATVEFFVSRGLPPTIYDVYTDTNPVQDQANFYVTHDRPDRQVEVTVEVYDLMGRRLWSATESGRSEMFNTMPITWDLLDSGGRRVPRGIYIYRATVSDADSGEQTSTASRKLAVRGVN